MFGSVEDMKFVVKLPVKVAVSPAWPLGASVVLEGPVIVGPLVTPCAAGGLVTPLFTTSVTVRPVTVATPSFEHVPLKLYVTVTPSG